MIFGGEFYKKSLVVTIIVLFLLTGLSPVYAEITYSESNSVDNYDVEPTEMDNENLMDRESFLNKYKLTKMEEYPYYYHNPISEPTVIDRVDGSWDIIVPDDYDTIQDAVDHAGEGYRIFVGAGTYKENVEIDVQLLTLHGEDREITIIDGSGYSNVIMVTDDADGVNISGFTIKNSGDNYAGIDVSSHYNIIQDNIVVENDDGIRLYLSSGNQIQGNQIEKNANDGLWLHRSNGNNVIDNAIEENGDNGIEFTYSSLGTTIEDNTISDNDYCGILLNQSSLGNTIKENNIENNDFGVKCIGVSDGNIFHHNSFIGNTQNAYDSCMDVWDGGCMGNYWDDYTGVDSDGDGIGDTPYNISGGGNQDRYPFMNRTMITEKSERKTERETNSNLERNKISIGGCSNNDGWDIIVPDDYPAIQEAVDNAKEGDRILVKHGVYNENLNITVQSLILHGEDKETTIIDGNNNDAHIISIKASGTNISGFTIRNSGSEYAGISIYAGSNTFQDNIITDCDFGIRLFGHDRNIVDRNTMTGNKFGMAVWMSTDNNITDNTIDLNYEDGIVLLEKSTVRLQENIVENNSFNSILMIGCSNVYIGNNSLKNNGWFGLQMFSLDNNIVEDNGIHNNSYDGISLHKSTNNIFRGNTLWHNDDGVSFWFFSNNNAVSGNNISNNDYGISIGRSANNNISKNTVRDNNRYGISIVNSANNNISKNNISNNDDGIYLWWSSNNNVSENTIIENNNQGVFIVWSSNNHFYGNTIAYSNSIYGISLGWSSNNTLCGNNIHNNREGISLGWSSNNTLCGNNIHNNGFGIKLFYSSNNRVSGNNIHNNYLQGIDLLSSPLLSLSDNNMIYGNTISNNGAGICLVYSSNNDIVENLITDNKYFDGIWLDHSSNNNISKNTITDNNRYGISIGRSANNNVISENIVKDNNEFGICLWDSSNGIITDNTLHSDSIILGGNKLEYWNTHTIENNRVNGKLIRYYKNSDNVVVPVDTVQVILVNCTNFTIQNLNLSYGDFGIQLGFSSDCKISRNNFLGNEHHATFCNSFSNNWFENYWDDWTGIGPKFIYGKISNFFLLFKISIPWFNFDWHPAKEPYDIGG